MKTLDWLLSLQQHSGAFPGWEGGALYPEVTGYLIPTLLQWDRRVEAQRAADWLVSVQNPDGSFSGMDGLPRVFDTGACWEGLHALNRNEAAQRAKDWLLSQKIGDSYNARVCGLLGKEAIFKLVPHFRSHYWAYNLEGLYLMGLRDLLVQELLKLPRGLQSFFVGENPSQAADTCATAQIAKLRILMGMDASEEMDTLRKLVNPDGSLPHSLTNPGKFTWTAKFYLDCEHLLQCHWNRLAESAFRELYDIDLARWAEKHSPGISGCFRVRNDHEFLYEAVTSHLPYLDEAVIALQPSDSKTEEVISRLEKLPKVRVARYPIAPVFITDPEWEAVPENSIRSFVYLSNWALSQCRYSWIARIEADVICLSSFARIVERIRQEPDRDILYGRAILNLAGVDRRQISATVPRNGGWDECVFPNKPAYHFTKRPRYEVLENPYDAVCMGWSAHHLKRCKSDKIGWNGEQYLPFDREHVAQALREFNRVNPYPGIDNPEGETCLFELS